MQTLNRPHSYDLAYNFTPANEQGESLPCVVFLGGFKSDMQGTKALYLEEQCKARGQAYLRLDYGGHGASGSRFTDGTIGLWARDAADVIRHAVPQGRLILVGSSMGGWISLILARKALGERVAGFVGIAAAPDFTRDLMAPSFTDAQRKELEDTGRIEIPNDDEPYIITKALLDDGALNCVLDQDNSALSFPIHLVQGKQDEDVPWETAEKIKQSLLECDVQITYIEDGDHRLSKPEELEVIDRAIVDLS